MKVEVSFHPETARISLDYFLEIICKKCISNFNQSFECVILSLTLIRPKGDFLDPVAIIKRKSKAYISEIEKVFSLLPTGVKGRIEVRENTATWRRYSASITYTVYVSVSAEYCKKTYAEMSSTNIVLMTPVSPSFQEEANAFKNRILAAHTDTIVKIKNRIWGRHIGVYKDGVALFDGNGYQDWELRYSVYGLKELASTEQCFGVVLAVSELFQDLRFTVTIGNNGVSVETHYPPEKPPVLMDW